MADTIENAEPPPFEFDENSPPSPDQLLSLLDSLTGLSEEDREQLRSELLYRKETGEFMPTAATSIFSTQMIILASMLLLLTLIFVFFGYKLYKNLTEKERKREQKKKLKLQKKKK